MGITISDDAVARGEGRQDFPLLKSGGTSGQEQTSERLHPAIHWHTTNTLCASVPYNSAV